MPAYDVGIQDILGKTITGVLVKIKKGEVGAPGKQVFLIFSDGTAYEFYGDYPGFSMSSSLDQGGMERAKNYMSQAMKIVFEAVLDKDGKVTATMFDPHAS
jgi:hypothetical protein